MSETYNDEEEDSIDVEIEDLENAINEAEEDFEEDREEDEEDEEDPESETETWIGWESSPGI